MTHMARIILGLMMFGGPFGQLHADLQDVAITATKKKIDESKNLAGQGAYVKTSQVVYAVTVQNKTFKELKDITIKYMVFYDKANLGEKEQPGEVSVRGEETIPVIGKSGTTKFETKPISLTTASLESGWSFDSGAKNYAKDRIAGVWFRAYSGDKIIGEYANPSSMASRVWKN